MPWLRIHIPCPDPRMRPCLTWWQLYHEKEKDQDDDVSDKLNTFWTFNTLKKIFSSLKWTLTEDCIILLDFLIIQYAAYNLDAFTEHYLNGWKHFFAFVTTKDYYRLWSFSLNVLEIRYSLVPISREECDPYGTNQYKAGYWDTLER